LYIIGKGADPNLPKCKKKKSLRIEKKLAKNPNFVIKPTTPQQISLEDLIADNDSVVTDKVKKLRVSCYINSGRVLKYHNFKSRKNIFNVNKFNYNVLNKLIKMKYI